MRKIRYVIMANGKGRRWGNHRGVPKHLVTVHGETLLERTTRLVHAYDADAKVVITSSNPQCEALGASRHVPARDAFEIDRFCYELIEDDVCFLYGDAYYTDETMRSIVSAPVSDMLFFGTTTSIVAVKVGDGCLMRRLIDNLVSRIECGEIEDAKGWQLYHSFMGAPLEGYEICGKYIRVSDETTDFNWPEEYERFQRSIE